jgi:hypothetical protein
VTKLPLALLAALLLSCFTSGATAASKKLQVLALMSEDAVPEALALTEELKRAVASEPELELIPGDYALEVLLVALGCREPPDDACFKRIAAKIGTVNFAWGRLVRRDSELELELHHWEKDHESARSEVRYDPSAGDAAHADAARAAIAQLLSDRDGPEPPARAAPAPNETVQELAPPPTRVIERRSTAPVLGYTLLAGGLVLAGGGVYAALRVDAFSDSDDFRAYRAGTPRGSDACREAELGRVVDGAPAPATIDDDCKTTKTFQVLQYVFFGLGAAAAATGSVLVLTHDSDAPRSAGSARPRVALSPQGARVALDVAF